MRKKITPPTNMLSQMHSCLNNLANCFRDKVCEECGWSTPTFYRKMRKNNISNAEKDKIAEVFFQLLNEHAKK